MYCLYAYQFACGCWFWEGEKGYGNIMRENFKFL